jgi:hypothetical protein
MLKLPTEPRRSARTAVRTSTPTIGSTWLAASQRPAADELLAWPPDVFAFTDLILDRAEAYRFVVSTPAGHEWPPAPEHAWRENVRTAARRWSGWVQDRLGSLPELVAEEWRVMRAALDTPLEDIASGEAWRICEALLTLHAVSDETCATVAGATPDADNDVVLRARVSELLARTGTIARIDPTLLRVLPKYRTPHGGIQTRSISRYLARTGPSVSLSIDRVATRRDPSNSDPLNVLLLPWPLRIAPDDFHPVRESIQKRELEPFGYFRFEPSERLDVSLVDRLLTSASEHVDRVDVVVLPESAVARRDLPALEAALSRQRVRMLIAGVRDRPVGSSGFASNWVHFGAEQDGRWWRYRQDKHHRWSLDRSQIEQYHLTDVLDPRVRWWEAIELNRRSLQIIERDDGHTIASLVCEDLAHIDDVFDLLREVGPALVVGLLLDGPQLGSRWMGRYASVLADDPGSAVLTLTSHGMVASAWRDGQPSSSVVALWKDNARGSREIALEPDAQGILLALHRQPAIRRVADGRLPELTTSDLRLSGVIQVRAAATAREPATDAGASARGPALLCGGQ